MNKLDKIRNFNPSGVGLRNGNFIGLPFDEIDAELILFPVPWDATVSYADGTASAPQNILQASAQLDLYDADLHDAWKTGIFFATPSKVWQEKNTATRSLSIQYIEALENGVNFEENPHFLQHLQKINNSCLELVNWVYDSTKKYLQQGKIVGLVGGEHSTPLGYLAALAERYTDFGILQIDAHCDLRRAYEGFTYSHASIFYNALKIPQISKLVQVGIRDYCEEEANLIENSKERVVTFFDQKIKEEQYIGHSFHQICLEMLSHLPQYVYISFDIDGLNPALCPNTGTPVAGGLEFHEAIYLIKLVAQSGRKIIGFDLSEVGGEGNEWDGNVAARVLYKLCNWTAYSQGKIQTITND